MSYLFFSQIDQANLKQQFLQECPLILRTILTDKQYKSLLKVKFCKAARLDIYLVMISCHLDRVLINLGKSCGFPRGFPCIWQPGKILQTFGFYPKFDNDDRQEPDSVNEFDNLASIRFFEKWSGFLGQVFVFKFNGVLYWTVTSKNSGHIDSEFVKDAHRIVSPKLTNKVVSAMYDQSLHFCCEIMSQNDQTHGAQVLQENFIITALGVGCTYYLDNSQTDNIQDRFVNFKSHQEIIHFCQKYNLPCGAAVIINGRHNIKEFMTRLSNKRDFMNLETLNSLVADVIGVRRVQGTVDHQTVLGNVLEGLVLHLTDVSGKSWVKKYKFPNYTIRTMLFRTLFNDFIMNSAHLKQEAQNFVKFWCVSKAGKQFWYKFALAAFIIKANFQNPNSGVGDHILIADQIQNQSDPDQINNAEEKFEKMCADNVQGTVVLLLGPIGSGKTTYMQQICENNKTFYPIDGDLLDLNLSTVTKLGSERNDFTIWKIIEALMMGLVPVVSTGGGVLHTFKGEFILGQRIQKALCTNIKIVLILPDPTCKEVVNVSSNYDPLPLYSDKGIVENAISRRLECGEWTRPPEFKTNDSFIDMIVRKSSENCKFAKSLLQQANTIFTVPVITKDNYASHTNVDLSAVTATANPCSPIKNGLFSQIRLLVKVVGKEFGKEFVKIGHITWIYNKNGNQSFSIADFASLLNKYPSREMGGNIFKIKCDGKEVSLAIPEIPIHSDNSTHITLNPGAHTPNFMRNLALGIVQKLETVTIPNKNGKECCYKMADFIKSPCQLQILSAFGI